MTLQLVLEKVPVEELHRGDQVFVHERVGLRPVIRVDHFATLGTEQVECYVVVYEPEGPGVAWENRARRKNATSTFEREEASLKVMRKGEFVAIAPRGLGGAELEVGALVQVGEDDLARLGELGVAPSVAELPLEEPGDVQVRPAFGGAESGADASGLVVPHRPADQAGPLHGGEGTAGIGQSS